MKEFVIEKQGVELKLNLATKVSEITNEYLEEVLKDVHLADDYAIVGLITHEQLSTLVIASSRKKNLTTGVIPVFAKVGKSENDFVKSIKIGSKVVIDTQELMLGHHVVAPRNNMSLDKFLSILNDSKDGRLYQKAVEFGDEVCFVDFKIVPSNQIRAFYDK